ncbi:MAG: desulfoferrodoxin [Candidatus Krumholzibacteria bacterium]|nr:desulfoferrodoxin [Candidatus Krumholzibacteria bacterium]
MTALLQIYKCEICGNIVEVIHDEKGQLVCCGKPMTYLEEGITDAAVEKHVPVIEKIDGGYKVKVGKAPHPMADAHYIMWIELVADGKTHRQFLEPGGAPEAVFSVKAQEVSAREYCNLHGLWKDK